MSLYVGTCGFSYKDWIGPFYPQGIRPSEMLGYYARHFPTVEIDSTYYAIPRPAVLESMVRRTPPQFRFTVKAPGSLTHLPAEALPLSADADAFADAIQPLADAGKLATVLLQFPHAFRPGADAYRRLELLRRGWPEAPLVAEFRHRDWQRDATLLRLKDLGIGWCNVDEPRFATLLRPSAEVTSPVGYFRFHGRNVQNWWKQGADAGARYDYLYSKPELEDWLPRIAEVADQAEATYVFFNNHRLGKAAMNARDMSHLLHLPTPETAEDLQLRLLDRSDV